MNLSKRNYTLLTESQVKLIKGLLKGDFNQTKLAIQFGVSRACINRIANNHTWVDI